MQFSGLYYFYGIQWHEIMMNITTKQQRWFFKKKSVSDKTLKIYFIIFIESSIILFLTTTLSMQFRNDKTSS